jgi:hypothetical protein
VHGGALHVAARVSPAVGRPLKRDRSELQARITASRWWRALVSVFIAATLVGIVTWDLPDSQLKADLLRPLRSFVNSAGLDQNWAVFAPDPRRIVLQLRAHLTYDDGSTADILAAPHGDTGLGAYRYYRWSKWVEYVRADDHQDLWKPTATFIARQHRRDGRLPISVTLIRRWYVIPPPGPAPGGPPHWQQFAYFTLSLAPSGPP